MGGWVDEVDRAGVSRRVVLLTGLVVGSVALERLGRLVEVESRLGGAGSERGGVGNLGKVVECVGGSEVLRGDRKGLWRALSRRRRFRGCDKDMSSLDRLEESASESTRRSAEEVINGSC